MLKLHLGKNWTNWKLSNFISCVIYRITICCLKNGCTIKLCTLFCLAPFKKQKALFLTFVCVLGFVFTQTQGDSGWAHWSLHSPHLQGETRGRGPVHLYRQQPCWPGLHQRRRSASRWALFFSVCLSSNWYNNDLIECVCSTFTALGGALQFSPVYRNLPISYLTLPPATHVKRT